MDRRKKRNQITTSELDAAWAELDASNTEPSVPPGVKALTLRELMVRWNINTDTIGSRKAFKEYRAGRLDRAKIVKDGRRIFVYWPKGLK